jgi:curved DNA-binding protein CbpA
MPDYYTILEVSPTASEAEIKRSYRRLARMHHPDLNAQALDVHIKRLNEAYAVLRDPQKRAAYDAQRAEEARKAAALRLQQQRIAELKRRRAQAQKEKKMTWAQGIAGFVRELKKEMKDD